MIGYSTTGLGHPGNLGSITAAEFEADLLNRAINDRFGGSGGLSLRRMSRVKQVLEFQARLDEAPVEDHFLVDRLGLLPDSKMATPEVEAGFSVEGIWHDRPMGYHLGLSGTNLHKDVWDNFERRRHIFQYCPEIKMIMGMRFLRERCSPEEARKKEEEESKKEEERKKKDEEEKEEASVAKEDGEKGLGKKKKKEEKASGNG